MALSQKHRSSIFTNLTPVLGEEEAEALLSHFPARDLDEPVTKEFVQLEIATLRTEIAGVRSEMHVEVAGLRGEVAELRAELHVEVAGLRSEMSEMRSELRGEIAELRVDMSDRFRQHTMWIAGTNAVAVAVAVALARVVS